MRPFILSFVTACGLIAGLISGWFVLKDWAQLDVAYRQFERLSASGADLRALFVAESAQNVHRINCFADGVGVLLGAILAAIGIHGLCLLPKSHPGTVPKK